MNRTALTATLLLAGLGLAACGAAPAAAGTSVKASPSPGLRVRNGTQGELVQINGTNLILNSASGDLTVAYTDATTFQKTSSGSLQDIAVGRCVVASGAKDPSGNITAATVRLADKVGGTCTAGPGPGGGGGGFAGGRPTPLPGASPRPSRGNLAFVAGEVTAVAGTAITVQPAGGAPVTVTVATTVRVSKSSLARAADLALHQCLAAQGPKDASGKVTARAISIVPAGPTGCFTGGGGFGGFGRASGGGAPPTGD